MGKKRRDTPVYAFRRRGYSLVPELDYDATALDGVAEGDRVRIEITPFRNLDRLRAWWATLQDCIDACGLVDWTKEALADFVKLKCGYAEIYQLPGGLMFKRARSIAFTSGMSEDEMVELFHRTEKLLAEEFGYVDERWKPEAIEIDDEVPF